ncbi:MAG: SDR family NAD(P)-dependent oxidoreductase [Alphaproteobacteria bacterium]|nr:SDR family NAD(P)-dependent oxidoreductase [Alphaproteobacteria bacterium]
MADGKRLEGKKALITGAASGIGEAIAKAFLDEGAAVLAVDLPQKNMSATYSDFAKAYILEQDITEAQAPDHIIATAIEKLGGIDILVNNAGIAIGSTLESTTDELWTQIMDVNLVSMFKISRAALPHLKKSGKGRIINLGSIMSDFGGPNLFVYGTSKHAVAGMTKSMAVDLGEYGITANYLKPSAIVTPLSAPFFEDETFKNYWIEKAPAGRLGVPEDVTAAAVFLASEEAQFISGLGLNVCGGAIIKF